MEKISFDRAQLFQLQFDHKVWLNRISYIRKEIELFQEQIEFLLSNHLSGNLSEELDFFQTSMVQLHEEADKISHHINIHRHYLQSCATATQVALNTHFYIDHQKTQNDLESLIERYEEEKGKLNRLFFKLFSRTDAFE